MNAGTARLVLLLALGVTAAFGVLSLWTPFSVDQALFVYGGKAIASGEALYKDFWDIKQPGVFFFYALGGWLFDFSEPGIHTLELVWQLALALLLAWIARQCTSHRAAVALAPLATVGVYYAFARSEHLTQVEALVGLPVTLSLVSAHKLAARPRSVVWSLLFGASTATVGALKLAYMALPFGFALLMALELGRQRLGDLTRLARGLAGFVVLGFVAVWAPLVAYFGVHGALPELLWTSFGYPAEALQQVPVPPLDRLTSSFEWILGVYFGFTPLILLGLTAIRRPRAPVLVQGAVVYLVMSAALILVQKFSWWEYHLVLLFPPLGLLASLGLSRPLEALRVRPFARTLSALWLAFFLILPVLTVTRRVAGSVGELARALPMDTEASLSMRLDERYLRMWEGTRFLRRQNSRSGPIYVFGDPRILLLSERRQAIAVHGHAWEHLPNRLWERLPAELMAARPVYVFVSRYDETVLRRRSPELLAFLENEYDLLRRDGFGSWRVRGDRDLRAELIDEPANRLCRRCLHIAALPQRAAVGPDDRDHQRTGQNVSIALGRSQGDRLQAEVDQAEEDETENPQHQPGAQIEQGYAIGAVASERRVHREIAIGPGFDRLGSHPRSPHPRRPARADRPRSKRR